MNCPERSNCEGPQVFFTRNFLNIPGRVLDSRCERHFSVFSRFKKLEIKIITQDEYEALRILEQ